MAKGLYYLAIAVLIVVWAMQNKKWSWPLFGWVMLMTVVIGGAAIWAGTVLVNLVGPANQGLGVVVDLSIVFAAVAIITVITIKIAPRYRPPR